MNEPYNEFFHAPRSNDVLLVLLNGMVVSAASLVLALLVGKYLIAGPICHYSGAGLCVVPLTFSYNIFLIIGALASIAWFVYGRIFRPALVALPSVILFWSLPNILSGVVALGWPVFALIDVALITFSYLVFYWLVRISNFFALLLLWLVIVIGLRLFLVL